MFRSVSRFSFQQAWGLGACLKTAPRACLLSSQVDVDFPSIPVYKPRTAQESVDRKRARLLYQSRKRGMLENGLLLSTFAAEQLSSLSEEQLGMYDNLINKPSNDWEIYYWITGKQDTPVEYDNEVMDMLKKHAKNENKDQRFHQPPLY